MPFLLGVLMGVAGLAMVILGEVTLPGGGVIKSKPSRRAGIVWLSFFPLAFLVSAVLRFLGLDEAVDPRLVFWIVSTLCLCVGLGYLLPAWSAGRPRRRKPAAAKSPANLFEAQPAVGVSTEPSPPPSPEPEPWLAPAETKPARRRVQEEKNPFDFS
jgi:hypothetical protein